jgi:hypothetical protein
LDAAEKIEDYEKEITDIDVADYMGALIYCGTTLSAKRGLS